MTTSPGRARRMAAKKKSSFFSLIGLDLLSLGLTWVPGMISFSLSAEFISRVAKPLGWVISAFFALVVLLTTFLLSVRLIRFLLPKLKEGLYPAGLNAGFLTWYSHLALSRSASVFLLKPLLQSTYITRFLFWRALGVKAAFDVHSSFTVEITDGPWVSIGSGTTLAEDVRIAAHTFVGDQVYIGRVLVGEDCFVGVGTTIGPKTELERGAWVGAHESLLRKKIA